MDKDNMQKVIEALREIQQRPGMYMAFTIDNPAINWLEGFRYALGLLENFHISRGMDIYENVAAERGWHWNGISIEMTKRELSKNQMVNEVLAIEIAVWEKLLEQLDDSSTSDATQIE